MSDSAEMLANVPLFAGVDRKQLSRLVDVMSERTFAEGETAVEEGRGGAGFWLIESGDANVSIGGRQVRTLGAGDYFGEIALIDDGPRSATVVAATDLRCRGIAAWEFKGFIADHPEAAWPIMQTLARRLREAEARSAD
jgi:CRP/FNR family transcriptional regulator, cyclic AMP receptor protein